MKCLVAFTVCLLISSGCQAGFFDSLKEGIKGTLDAFVDAAKGSGLELLAQFKQKTGTLVSQLAQSLIFNAANAMNTAGSGSKRTAEAAAEKLNNLEATVGKHMGIFQGVFNSLTDSLQSTISKVADLTLDQFNKKIDDTVKTHNLLTDIAMQAATEDLKEKVLGTVHTVLGTQKRGLIPDAIKQHIMSAMSQHAEKLKQLMAGAGQAIQQAATAIHEAVSGNKEGGIGAVKEHVMELFQSFIQHHQQPAVQFPATQ
ncbi:hypothetical protein ScPMuIL_017553 [Solemya velum]